MIKSAFKDIARGKLSSLITICGISVSVAAVVIISLISFTGKDMISSELANLGVSGIMILPADENNTQSLGTAQLEQIKQFECVSSAMPVLAKYIDITVKNQTNTCVVWGVDSGQKQVFDLNLLHGRLLSDDDIKKENKVCIVDETYAVGLYKRTNIVGKEIKISLNGAEENFQVVGVVSSGGVITQGILKNFTPYFVYLPFTTMQTIGGYEGFSQVAVKLKNDILPAQGETILNNQLKQTFKNQGEYYTQNMAEKKSAIDSSLDTVAIILALIAAISLIVSGLTVMIVMLSLIKEKTKEIGIKKAIGAKKSDIAKEFLLQAVLFSTLGTFIGMSFGVFVFWVGCSIFSISFSLNYFILLFISFFCISSGCVFGLFPAIKASKLNPVDAFMVQ